MRKLLFVATCVLMVQIVAPIQISGAEASGVQRDNPPSAFLPKSDSNVTLLKKGESISLQAYGSTLEEVLQRITEEEKVVLRFYCQDPGLKQERVPIRISGDLEKVIRQLLLEGHSFALLNREGKRIEDGKDVGTVDIYPRECAGRDRPVRIFTAEKTHPLLKRPPKEISLEELGEVLRTEGPACRRRAADILGIKGDEKGIPYAREALRDENPGVMLSAANALSRLGRRYGSERVADAIYGRFREKPYAQFLPIMAEVDKDKIWPIIDALMVKSDEREKGIIASALLLTHDRRAIKYLSKISSGSTENTKQVIFGMGKIGGPEAATALMKLLKGREAQKQAWAAQAVSFLPKGEGLEVRSEVEKIVRGEKVSDELLQALVEVGYLEPLEKLMKSPASKPEQKIRVLRVIGARGTEKCIEVMGLGLKDKSPEVRVAAAATMRVLAIEESVPYLINATEDKSPQVRVASVKALSEFSGNDGVVTALGKAIRDSDERVRKEAIDALFLLGKPSETMAAILRECQNHKDPYVARKAASTLTYWGLE